jgi:predicted nucleic acid-binding protein
MKLLIDTSIIIDYLRRKDKEDTLLVKLSNNDYQHNISIVTHTELYAGKSVWEDEYLYKIVEKLCASINILFIDRTISKKAGEIRARFDIKFVDAVIAATAIQNECSLVTLKT